ncbi:MAG TPA: amidohydrolase [Burkholderiaceae bacterium]|nr:amidohydrolase [Burkholderiaceae bacterium]
MDPARPFATHVAVKDGRILGVGSLDELAAWGPHALDRRFADKVLMPGFVEGHSHLAEGVFWEHTYCGYFDRTDPDGRVWPGLGSFDAVLAQLRRAEAALADPGAAVSGWGIDPIYFGESRLTRSDLDAVSATRPVGILHASAHILNVNTRALELAGLLRPGIDHPGVPLGPDGLPPGELRGPDAMTPAGRHVGFARFEREGRPGDDCGLGRFGRLCVRKGVTTATDLTNQLPEDAVETMLRLTAHADYPARIVPFRRFFAVSPRGLVDHAVALRARSTDRLRLGGVKLFADGSIQGFTARLRWPGYFNGRPNGIWYQAPENLAEALRLALAEGLLVNIHTNGDEAMDMAVDCIETVLKERPCPDHRITLQHCQLADQAMLARLRALGICASFFANHTWYWGDQHYAITVGPERAERMNPCASALAHGVPIAIHSDAPITPLDPLFTAWCAVNRITASGRRLGPSERIGVAQALRTITLGAAYTLKLDREIGSIECGKHADFAVLEDDPLEVAPERLREVRVWGTVSAGRVFPVSAL